MIRSPISVLHFSNSRVRGGVEEHILTLLRGLDRACFRLTLVCDPSLAEEFSKELPSGVEMVPLRFENPTQPAAAWRFARVLRRQRVDILHSHLFRASLAASPVGWICRVPVIVETPHLRERWRKGWLKSSYSVDRIAGRFVDHYIAVSEANGRYLTEEKRLPARKIVVIPNGCDLQRFDPERQPPAVLKRVLGFAHDDPVLVVVARLESQKGHRVLLDALPAVRARFPRVRLVCVGEGNLRADLERQVQALDLADVVRFAGYQADVPSWLALADVAVLPSFYEGMPLAAIESLAAGRPLIATAVDGTTEVVVDAKTGLTVEPGKAAELAHSICRLLADPDMRRRLARAGRQWVVERFSQERQIAATQSFYLQAFGRSRRAPEGIRPAVHCGQRSA